MRRPRATHFQDELLYKYAFFHFAPNYLANHAVDKNFKVDDAVLADFKQFLTSQNIPWTEKDISDNLDWLKINVKA